MGSRRSQEEGVTLGELLITIAILLVLASIAMPVYLSQQARTNEAVLRTNLTTAATFVTAAIASGVTEVASGGPTPYSGRMLDYVPQIGYWLRGEDFWIQADPSLTQFCITSQAGDQVLYFDTRRGGIVELRGPNCLPVDAY